MPCAADPTPAPAPTPLRRYDVWGTLSTYTILRTLNEYSLDKCDADIPARVSPSTELDVPMRDNLRTPLQPLDWEDTLIIDTSTPILDE